MTAASIRAPRGTYDVLPDQAILRHDVEQTAADLLESAGYGRIETPAFESTDLFSRGVGQSTDIVQKEMYSFEDSGHRSLTLRPEGTAPVCRAYVEHGMHKLPAPVKLYYFSNFFRSEKPQEGRYRQFWQVGAEVLGSHDPATDAESIVLAHALLDRLGARGLRLRLASLGSPDTRSAYRADLQTYLRDKSDDLSPEVVARIDLNPLRAFDSDDPGTRRVMAGAPRLLDRLSPDDAEHFGDVKALLEAAGVAYEIDSTLVRGLDYYTRTLFEFTSDALGAQSGVGGGGRYDGLVAQLGGPPTPGIGWAAGVERILLSAGRQPPPPRPIDLFVAYETGRKHAFDTMLDARRHGLRAQMELTGRSMKGQLKHADRLGARFVAVVAPDGIALRDPRSGTQRPVDPDQLIALLQAEVTS
ncbi:MAG TPA: histidine--tRNA ligase [Solirubrobacteraceae bacterium]|nr:histidine--tRNA ligase [Solirubrobacteraceae bacterium]